MPTNDRGNERDGLIERLKAQAVAAARSSEREAVEMAIDLVSFRKELVRGSRALLGIKLSRID